MKQFITACLFFSLLWIPQLPAVSYPEGILAKEPLCLEKMPEDPMRAFQHWYQCAYRVEGALNASSMTLATSTKEGRPSLCMMLLKKVDDQGLSFYGDLRSVKFQQLKANPYASIVFYWPAIQRQVVLSGKVVPIPPDVAGKHFASRRKEHQAASLVSHQDKPLKSRNELITTHQEVLFKHSTCQIPSPDHWGGYTLIPEQIEFWQAGPHTLHSRVEYTKSNGSWKKQLLHP